MNQLVSTLFLLTFASAQGGAFTNPTLDSQNPYFSRNVPNPGFWGSVPPSNANLFNSAWDGKGFQQMYNLNSQSPFAGNRGSVFDSMTKVFNPIGPTRFEFFPTQSNFMTDGELGSYTYDINEPRMRNIVKNYFRFFNKDLDRLSNVVKDNTKFPDLNNNETRRLQNPESFNYKNFFDGRDELTSTPVMHLPSMRVKTFFPGKARELGLSESFENFKKNLGINEEDLASGKISTPQFDRLQKLETQLHRIERKLALIEGQSGQKRASHLKSKSQRFSDLIEEPQPVGQSHHLLLGGLNGLI